MLQASDGGYLLYGGVYLPDKLIPSLRVVKLQPDGKISWEMVKASNEYYPYPVFLDSAEFLLPIDNGYTVFDGKGAIIRMDESGNVQWHRYYTSNTNDVITTSDRGYALSGSYYFSKKTDYSTKEIGWVIKLDSEGNKTWESQNPVYQTCSSITELADGNLQVRCSHSRSQTNESSNQDDFVDLNKIGNVIATKPVGTEENITPSGSNPYAFSVNAIPGGKIHIEVYHPNAGGVDNLEIDKHVDHTNITDIYAVIKTNDKGFLVFSSVLI